MNKIKTLVIVAVLLFIFFSVLNDPSVKNSAIKGIQKLYLHFNF
ncbi:MAG: hypothetical protein ACYC5N_02640 [Endomicrobiales bacterium]